MRTIARLYALLLPVFFLISCNRNAVELSETNAREEVPVLGNLEFRFSKALFPDSLLNRWDSTEYIRFSPAIHGRFRWETPDKLVFSPSEPLPPATGFTAKFTNELFRYSEYNKVEDGDKINFYTASLQLAQSYVAWTKTAATKPTPVMHLVFNHPVDAEKLKEVLELKSGDATKNFALMSTGTSDHLQVRLTDIPVEDRETPISIKIPKKLLPEGGRNEAKEDITAEVTVPSPFRLDVLDVQAQLSGNIASIQVRTSQPFVGESMKEFVKTEPALDWEFTLLDDGFLMTADQAKEEMTYELIINKGLKGAIGGVLKETYTQQVAFGELEPDIRFTNSKGMYLGKMGARNMEISVVSVPKVKITVSKIYESNLLAAQRYGYYPRDEAGDYYYDNADFGVLGDVVYEKEINTSDLPKYGNSRLFNFNLEDRIQDFKGIYHVSIRSMEDYWVRDSRFVALSDLGLIAREGAEDMTVFVQSIQTTNPVPDAQLTVYGSNNQVLGVGSTDKDGVGKIKYIRKEPSGFKPAMVTVKTASDFNYLPFQSTRVNASRFEVGGKRMHSSGLDAYVYAERDMYRPGETFRYAMIVRDQQWKVPGELPLKLRFVMPSGKEWTALRKNADAQGALEGTLDIPASALTGTYTLEVYTGNDLLLTTYPFQVEEFVPDRLKVQASTGLELLKPGTTATLNIQADYFFGSPAADRKWETEIQLQQQSFRSKKFPGYDFNLANHRDFYDKVVQEGKTDAAGHATLNYTAPAEYKNRGLLQAAFYTTVFDESGRPVSRHHKLPLFTQDYFLGLGADDYGYYPLRQSIRFPLIAVDKNDQPVSAKAHIRVVKKTYKTVLTRNGGYFRYDSQPEEIILQEKDINITGTSSQFSFVPTDPGSYEVRVYMPGATTYIARSFYSYGSWGIAGGSFDVNTEGNVDISPDKNGYKPGEKARILFKAPFDGRMLVTVENNGVLAHQYLEVKKRTATWELNIDPTHLPNVYITATLIKPHQVADIPLTVAHGFQSLRVEELNRKIPIEVNAPAATRSGKKQTIRVKAAPGAMVSIAAVDNGILQVSDFKSPDPYAYFYQSRALGVNAFDIYPLLLPELKQRLSSTGGDGGLSMEKRINPITNKRFKLVSFWSGLKKADGSGNVSFDIDVPTFSGELRIMSVAFKDDRFGAATNLMKVADPLVVSTALPRFLSPGDTLEVPVSVMNTTNKSTSVTGTLQVGGALKVVGSATAQGEAQGGKEVRLVYKLVAGMQPGTAEVKTTVKGLGETFTEQLDITVRPASTLQTRSGSGVVTAGKNLPLNLPVNDFMPGSVTTELVTGASPLLEWGVQLSDLLQYPYGCTEQTISAAFPQLYFGDLANAIKGKKTSTVTAAAHVQEAIRKIKARQLYNGAVMMWDNTGEENWWATVFAAHFLLEAEKAGYSIDKNLIEPMLSYLQFRLRNRQFIAYTYNRDQQKKIAPKEVPYSLYVLSLSGKPQAATLNYYKAHPEWLSLDGRYMLAAAFAAAGDKKRINEILPASFTGEVSTKQTGGSFYSPLRDEAMALLMLVEADPKHPQIPVLARKVAASLKQNRWLSTQEMVFSMLGLGKLAANAGKANITGSVLVNGKKVGAITNAAGKLTDKELKGTVIALQTTGTGNLYYFWKTQGISATGDYVQADNGVKVRRQFYSRTGVPLSTTSFSQNDLIIVGISVENMYKGTVENMVITDLLPACFEIENPRIRELPGMDWIKNASVPTAMDIRDDRIHFFMDLSQPKQTYYYAVRAVSPGVFKMGPASVEAMYDGAIHSYNGGGVIRVGR